MNSNNTASVEYRISRDNIVSSIAAFLQAIRVIPSKDHILDIQFGDMTKDPVYIIVKYKEEAEVLTFGNGTQLPQRNKIRRKTSSG